MTIPRIENGQSYGYTEQNELANDGGGNNRSWSSVGEGRRRETNETDPSQVIINTVFSLADRCTSPRYGALVGLCQVVKQALVDVN